MSGTLWYQLEERFRWISKSRLTGSSSCISPWKPPFKYVVLKETQKACFMKHETRPNTFFLLFPFRCSVPDLYILRFVSLTVIISTTGGILTTRLKGCLAKQFLTDRRPRSATMTLEEEEDCGRKITGALKWTLKAIRLLLSASSFTPVAAFSAAWAVTSTKASLASWKLLIKACDGKNNV